MKSNLHKDIEIKYRRRLVKGIGKRIKEVKVAILEEPKRHKK